MFVQPPMPNIFSENQFPSENHQVMDKIIYLPLTLLEADDSEETFASFHSVPSALPSNGIRGPNSFSFLSSSFGSSGHLSSHSTRNMYQSNSPILVESKSTETQSIVDIRRKTRIKKWNRMLSRSKRLTRQKKFSTRLIKGIDTKLTKGIPEVMRSTIWKILLSDKNFLDFDWSFLNLLSYPIDSITTISYFESLFNLHSEYEKQIDLDISRTMRSLYLFKERYGQGQSSLFKILVSLANAMPVVGYCQGMSTVCGFLLSYFHDEHVTFKSILYLFGRDTLFLLYSSGFPKLFETFKRHDYLLQRSVPRLWAHFQRLHIYSSTYATKWYLTLFLCFPKALSVRIWDLYLYYGFDILIFAGVTILLVFSKSLLQPNFDELMFQLSSCFEGDLQEGNHVTIDSICRKMVSMYKKKGEFPSFSTDPSNSSPLNEFITLSLDNLPPKSCNFSTPLDSSSAPY